MAVKYVMDFFDLSAHFGPEIAIHGTAMPLTIHFRFDQRLIFLNQLFMRPVTGRIDAAVKLICCSCTCRLVICYVDDDVKDALNRSIGHSDGADDVVDLSNSRNLLKSAALTFKFHFIGPSESISIDSLNVSEGFLCFLPISAPPFPRFSADYEDRYDDVDECRTRQVLTAGRCGMKAE